MQVELNGSGIPADYSTVFRALLWLADKGIAQRVDLGDGKARYELTTPHHEHVQCERCGKVAEVPGCVVDQSTAGIEAATGYSLTSHRLLLSGLCPTCQAA
jgi:Fe2+ or Zn2+ uptake regulation protein